MNQKEEFLKSEGDNYFLRTAGYASYQEWEFLEKYVKYIKKEDKILEIGCSSGAKLDYFYKKIGCEGHGIDPSPKAIEEGKNKYPHLKLQVGTADALSFPDNYFDFVIFGFCLYLVDRQLLSRAVAEADRVLKDGGFLGITDFDAKIPKKRPYRHLPGIYSYKMDYAAPFLALPHFSLIYKYFDSLSGNGLNCDISQRVVSVILYKNHDDAYIAEEDK